MGTLRTAIPTWAIGAIWGLLVFSDAGRAAPAATGSLTAGWPKSFVAPNGAKVTINHPQIAEWPNQSAVTFYAAVTYQPKGTPRPALGTVAVEADTTVAFHDRLVHFSHFAVVDASFPTLGTDDVATIVTLIEKNLPPDGRSLTLDSVLAALESKPVTAKNALGLKADPPLVLVSKKPAIVVNIDGAPLWRSVVDDSLQSAINTNWDLFRAPESNAYYLRDDRMWLVAQNVLGPWTRSRTAPPGVDRLPNGDRWSAVKAAQPAKSSAATVPRVFVSRQPAELIVLTGEPVYRRVPGTKKLEWVSNTDSDVFRDGPSGALYYLVAGRWFAAPDFAGPWTFATHALPADFLKIPLDHPRSHVLASVPGTRKAAEAVLLAQVPHVVRVNKNALRAPAIEYDGAPVFHLIPGTPVGRAVNADKDVIKAGRQFYLCFEGVWFASSTPTGPWKVTGTVPAAIYLIPPTSSLYRVTYVTVDEDRDDWTVFRTASGYTGAMVAGNSVVFGTGYTYMPYVGGFVDDPKYFPRPATYGVGAWYNPWSASFGRGRTGYGPAPPTALSAPLYAYWDPRLVQGVDRGRGATTSSAEAVGTTGVLPSTAAPRAGGAANLFAGRDGSVYRRRAAGWDKYQNGAWVAMRRGSPNDEPILRQLDDDARARTGATARNRAAIDLQSDWGPRAASYRPPADRRGVQ